MEKMKEFLRNYYELPIAMVIFIATLLSQMHFYQVIILMLEFIVILEIVRMINEYITNRTLRLRFVIDVFIVFLLRDIVIVVADKSTTGHNDKVIFLLFVVFVLFMFRIITIKFSPYKKQKLKNVKEELKSK